MTFQEFRVITVTTKTGGDLKGDALLQKNFTVDFLGHKVKINEGEVNQYYVENGHKAIIDPWLFDYLQEQIQRRAEFDFGYSGVSYYSSKFICKKCGAIYGMKPEHSNDKYHKDIWMCRNRFKKGIYCKNTRIDNANMDKLICQFAKTYVKRNAAVRNICEYICFETGNGDFLSEIKQCQQFEYSDIEDISIVISRFEVFPRNKIYVDFID